MRFSALIVLPTLVSLAACKGDDGRTEGESGNDSGVLSLGGWR